ncbi:hypothetical protein K8R66_00860 [bacterium]|nr:hypothetical protein [bacterium]
MTSTSGKDLISLGECNGIEVLEVEKQQNKGIFVTFRQDGKKALFRFRGEHFNEKGKLDLLKFAKDDIGGLKVLNEQVDLGKTGLPGVASVSFLAEIIENNM